MPKDAYWFKHDYNARGDLKLAAFIQKFKAAGLGIYWVIIEVLHEETTHKLLLNKSNCLAIANQTKANPSLVENVILACINEFFLFEKDGDFFSSNRVIRNLDDRNNLSQIRSKSGKLGGRPKQKKANGKQMITNCQAKPPGEERRGDKIKGDKSVLVPPTLDEVKKFFKEKNFPETLAEKAFDHYALAGWNDARGNPVRNWKQKMSTIWFTNNENQSNGTTKANSGSRVSGSIVRDKKPTVL